MVGSFIEAPLFGSMVEDEECDYDHTLIDDSDAQGGDKKNCCAEEDDLNMCKDVVIEMELMHSQAKNDLHEDMELQSELWHALDVLIYEHENIEMSSQSNVKSITAYVEVGSLGLLLVHKFASQLNGNPSLIKDWLTQIKASIFIWSLNSLALQITLLS